MTRGYHYIRYAVWGIYLYFLEETVMWVSRGVVPVKTLSAFGSFLTILVFVMDLRNTRLWRRECAARDEKPGFPWVTCILWPFYGFCFVWFGTLWAFMDMDPFRTWYPQPTNILVALEQTETSLSKLKAREQQLLGEIEKLRDKRETLATDVKALAGRVNLGEDIETLENRKERLERQLGQLRQKVKAEKGSWKRRPCWEWPFLVTGIAVCVIVVIAVIAGASSSKTNGTADDWG